MKFLLKFTLFVAGLVLIALYPLLEWGYPALIRAVAISLAFFYILTTLAILIVTQKGKRKKEIVNTYTASIGIKMLVGLIGFVIFLQFFDEFELEYTVSFFSSYLICTGFEVYYLLSNLRQISDALNNAES